MPEQECYYNNDTGKNIPVEHHKLIPLSILAPLFVLLFSIQGISQITTSNALPVGEGKGILRVQHKVIRATDDPTNANRDLFVQALPVVGVYGISSRLSVFGVVPILDKRLLLDTPQKRIRRDSGFGPGDIRLFTRYDIYRNTASGRIFSISPLAGLELPTGSDDQRDSFGRFPQPLQRGSGSWDPFTGAVFTYTTLKWFFDLATTYQVNTEANNFKFGNEYRLDTVVKYRLFPRQLQSGVGGFFYLDLESNLIIRDNNQINGSENPDTGGTTLMVAPGLQYITRKFVFETAVQLPAHQDLNGNALENDFITTVSIRMNL